MAASHFCRQPSQARHGSSSSGVHLHGFKHAVLLSRGSSSSTAHLWVHLELGHDEDGEEHKARHHALQCWCQLGGSSQPGPLMLCTAAWLPPHTSRQVRMQQARGRPSQTQLSRTYGVLRKPMRLKPCRFCGAEMKQTR